MNNNYGSYTASGGLSMMDLRDASGSARVTSSYDYDSFQRDLDSNHLSSMSGLSRGQSMSRRIAMDESGYGADYYDYN